MSVSLNELSYRIFNIIKPKIGDDESIDILEVKYDVENTRAMLIKQRHSGKYKGEISESIIQRLNKLEIEDVNSSGLLPEISSEKVLMRTVLKIPQLIQKSSGMPLIKRISSSSILGNNFSLVTREQATTSGNGKFNQKNMFCFYEDDYLYFITKRILSKGLKYIDLYGVFSRPTKVNDFLNTNYNTNYTDNDNYPINLDMIDDIQKIVIKDKIGIEASQVIDDVNDSSDTIKQTPAQ